MHFYKMISIFHKNYLNNPIAMLPLINSAPPITKLTIKLVTKLTNTAKKKYGQAAKTFIEQTRDF